MTRLNPLNKYSEETKFEVSTAACVKSKATTFWYVTPCTMLEIFRRLGETYCLSFTMLVEAVRLSKTVLKFSKMHGILSHNVVILQFVVTLSTIFLTMRIFI